MNLQRARSDKLARYDPDKGLKTIAVNEAAVKHFARAKDATNLQKAIRGKLEAQRDFVIWWDRHADKHPGRNPRRSARVKAGKNGIPDSYVIHRWRRKVGTTDALENTYQAAFSRYLRILEFVDDVTGALKASLSDEWYTPARYVNAARRVLGGFDLDPASSAAANKTIDAARYFTAKDKGEQQAWSGRVWCNPPYGGLSGSFAERLVQAFTAGDVPAAVLLVNANSTDAQWFQPLWNYLLCFTNHRINFIAPNGDEVSGSTHGSVFVYFGPDRDAFLRQFSEFGAIVERAR